MDLIEAVHLEPSVRMVTNRNSEVDYLFLGEDIISSSFKNQVYTIDGFDC
ncbi:MAG: hypothetical protein KAH01_07775 [Caldisericia bacterium]|nr:hypothetical protein [Caldisericia bacterium]